MKRATKPQSDGTLVAQISIHALVKRATKHRSNYFLDKAHFNPRPREEGDNMMEINPLYMVNFNPRPREEGDAVAHTGTVSDVDFNPRPREEGDFL